MSQNNQKIIVTRSFSRSQKFVENLLFDDVGFSESDFFIEPVLQIEVVEIGAANFLNYDGVIVTSANAGEILAGVSDFNKPVYCVGQSYRGAEISCPTVRELELALKERFGGGECNTHLLYFRGEVVSYDLASGLCGDGVCISEEVAYRAIASDSFSEAFLDLISSGGVRVLTFFSKRSCEVFLRLAKDSQILDMLKSVKALCISQSVLECCYSYFDEHSACAKTPDAEGMKQLILQSMA